ncbi:MAG: iron-sulfur cluster assembly accessory protein [Hyphomicrobiaceae bacterium]|nr:iron-sulfur cluster assembly accessory protein [Hyphomicrobiaceae bacterium]
MLELTDNAQKAILKFAATSDKPIGGLRIAVVDGGCSGLQYSMSLEEKPQDGDSVVECGETSVYIDPSSATVLKGVTVDFVDSLQGSGFTFSNPNASRKCACGKSFEACK